MKAKKKKIRRKIKKKVLRWTLQERYDALLNDFGLPPNASISEVEECVKYLKIGKKYMELVELQQRREYFIKDNQVHKWIVDTSDPVRIF